MFAKLGVSGLQFAIGLIGAEFAHIGVSDVSLVAPDGDERLEVRSKDKVGLAIRVRVNGMAMAVFRPMSAMSEY